MSGNEFLGITKDGSILAGANMDAFAVIRKCAKTVESRPPLAPGTVTDFKAKHEADPLMIKSLQNIVKIGKCGKANGYTMKVCNGCNTPIPADQPLAHTDNVLMAFVYGIEKTERFALNVSVRHESQNILIFDDTLGLTPCHINAIPTNAWIPDWRMLLRNPGEGLTLLNALEDAAWGVVRDQVLASPEWRKKCLRGAAAELPADDLRKYVCAGCNFPPSQFQLHLQYFLMPWLPSQYRSFLDGGQICKGRWFPLEYIKAVLGKNVSMEVTMDTPLEDIIDKFNQLGVNYDEMWLAQYKMVEAGHELLANWDPADFSLTIDESGTVHGDAVAGRTKQQVLSVDKMAMQSAATPEAKTYYSFARPERVGEWGA